jgi:hypothetical protein
LDIEMDSFLVKYLQSGKAWVLVGSGPSIQMGYPSWEQLASFALEVATAEQREHNLTSLNAAMKRKDYPRVFQAAKTILGGPRLLQHLRDKNRASRSGRIYELIAQWPVPVYLTTNYDDELQKHLANLGESYIPYPNSEDHLSLLLPELSGAIVKLHGDLRSESGLILTSEQYNEISEGDDWQYWRTKITSVFQMNRVVVIGHSLSDKNIKHVLEAARRGAGVVQPICWIAPNVSSKECREFLEKHRIRVIPYDNSDGEHRNLVKLIENVNEFIPPRTVVHVQEQIARVSSSPLGTDAAAPGFFVFNVFSAKGDWEDKRLDIVTSAIQSTLPELKGSGEFTLETALSLAGWPEGPSLAPEFARQVAQRAVEKDLLVAVRDRFRVSDNAEALALQQRKTFEHMRGRFKNSLLLRLEREYPALGSSKAQLIAADIESSLTGYFREGGLSLASTLFSSGHAKTVPSSIIPFMTLASARYDNILMRQAFFTVSVDAFVHPESADREYLGRISQGFFAFHALGVFGDVAIERLRHATGTVWLVDSDTQIRALALAAPANTAYRECFSRLHQIGIRFFTTLSLFGETREHLWFADNFVKENGPDSPLLIAAARGEPPDSKKKNEFLEGFIRWQAAGNRCDWQDYLYQILGHRSCSEAAVRNSLNKIGIEVVGLEDWPGFTDAGHGDVDEYVGKIARLWETTQQRWAVDSDQLRDPYKKAGPEAEAFIIVKREREGVYHIISDVGQQTPSWFLSCTSILNILEPGSRITWQPEAFLSFASTLCDISLSQSADNAFEVVLLGLAQSGLDLLSEDIVARVFGSAIDQAKLSIDELRQAYHSTLEQKYGESPDSVIARVIPSYRPLAVVQLANEVMEAAARGQQIAVDAERAATKRAEVAEEKLEQVSHYRSKMEAKKQRAKPRARKPKPSPGKNRRRKKKKG